MINRYTLEFRDQRLENMYQEFQLEHKRKPLAKVIIFLVFLIIIIQGTYSIISKNSYYLYSAAGLLCVNIFFLIIFYKRPQFLRYLFQGLTYLLILNLMYAQTGKSQFHYQLATAIYLGFQFVIIATGEFLDALFQIIVIYSAYLIYFIRYQENFSYALVAATFMIKLLLINSFYKNLSAERSKFQLTLIEDQWDQILFNTITQPSIIFSFDLIKHSFVLKKSIKFTHSCENTNELKQFLRQAILVKDNKINLEKHIYQCLNTLKKTHDKIVNESLFINFQKSIQEIKYSIFPGASPIILIQTSQGTSTTEFEKIENLYQFKYLTLLRTLQLKIKKMFQSQTNNFHEIQKIVIYKTLFEFQQMCFLKKLHLKQILKILKVLYKNRQLEFIFDNTCQNCKIGKVNILIMIVIEIFESIVSNQIITYINSTNDLLEFRIIGESTEKTILNLEKRLDYYQQYQIQLSIDKRGISFRILNDQIDVQNYCLNPIQI